MVGIQATAAFHTDRDQYGKPLTAPDRERLLKPYLPPTSKKQQSSSARTTRGVRFHHKQRVRPALRQLLYNFIYTVIHIVFSIYIRARRVYHAIVDRLLAVLHYHHRTPELIKKDVQGLSKVPKHLSVILDLPPEGGNKDRLETLINDACEVAAWSACAGVPMLSIYERTGVLKSCLPHVHRQISKTLTSYYGTSAIKPTISLRAPHLPSYSPPTSPPANSTSSTLSPELQSPPHLNILLIDESDGRQTLVDLTKTLASMSQDGKLLPADITAELIDAEISESVMGEPDLLICFGERVVLDGYPPWQVRLTEIYYAQDNIGGVGYHVFLRALYKFAKAEMRVGR